MPTSSERFRDPGYDLLTSLGGQVLVACPGCGSPTVVRPVPGDEPVGIFTPRRLACAACACVRAWPREGERAVVTIDSRGATDPFLGLPLWLQTPCRGHRLWAWNEPHLAALEGWIGAELRERHRDPFRPARDVHATMLETLPTWMTDRSARADVLAGLARLRARLPA